METISQIETSRIAVNPNNPRSRIEDVSDLVSSIKSSGLIQPITVRWTHKIYKDGLPTGYEVIAGSRRLTACQAIGMDKIPCIVMDANDDEAFKIATMENVVRENMNAVDEANAVAKLYSQGRNRHEIASIFGKSVRWAEGRRKIVSLGEKAMEALAAGTINLGHAEALTMCSSDRVEYFLSLAKWRNPSELKTMILKDRKSLDKAPFNVAKTCKNCENKSDNHQDLFGDVQNSLCLNEECYKGHIADEVARIRANFEAQGWAEVPEDEYWKAKIQCRTTDYINASTEDETLLQKIKELKAAGVKPRYWLEEEDASNGLVFRVKDLKTTDTDEEDEDTDETETTDFEARSEIRHRANEEELKNVEKFLYALTTNMDKDLVALFLDRCTDITYDYTECNADGDEIEHEDSPLLHVGEPITENGIEKTPRAALVAALAQRIVGYNGVDEELRGYYMLEPREEIETRIKEIVLTERKNLEDEAQAATEEE